MKIFFSVGEPSGDLHGANLIRALRAAEPTIECVGYGGPRMADAGCTLHADLTQLAVMWFARVARNLHRFRQLYVQACACFREQRPDAVILIDYPGFNWWIARAARRHSIPVFYYGVPQLWAWGGWRVHKLRQLVDHVLCQLPFEVEWYRSRGCEARYVGHPYFDQLAGETLDAAFIERVRGGGGPLVTILPGSRDQEVAKNLKWFLAAARRVQDQVPDVRFAIASFSERQAEMARDTLFAQAVTAEVHVGKTPELIEAARCCMACSGSVSLELLHHVKPSVILYWVERLPYTMAREVFLRARFITLVNLLASDVPLLEPGEKYDPLAAGNEAVPFPEYLTYNDCSSEIAAHLVDWILNDHAYRKRMRQLRAIKHRLALPGASARTADAILAALRPPMQLPSPHFDRPGLRREKISPDGLPRAESG